MRRQRLMEKRKNRGFTLVEIMVVVVILGLLATVVGKEVIPLLFSTKIDKAKVDIRTITDVVDVYITQNSGKLPDTIEDLITPNEAGYACLKEETVPVDPWGNEYVMEEHPEKAHSRIIRSFGPDGERDTDDDLTSLNIREKKEE